MQQLVNLRGQIRERYAEAIVYYLVCAIKSNV